MTNFLTDQQVANSAAAGGWTGADLVTAVAIAIAESAKQNPATGKKEVDSDAIGDVALETAVWGPSVGPWQIRSVKAERGKGTTRDQDANMHPVTNAIHAHQIWADAHGFTPWSTFQNQSYRLYIGRAQAVASTASADSSAHADPQPANAAQAAVDSLKLAGHVGAWIGDPHNITRVMWVVLGGGLVLAGAAVVSRPITEPALKAAVKVAGVV